MGFFRESQEGLGPPPPPFQVGEGGQGGRRNQRWIVLLGLGLLVLVVGGASKELYTDWLWFESVGYTSVFLTTLGARVGLFAAGAVVAFLFIVVNLVIARQVGPRPGLRRVGGPEGRLAQRLTTLTALGIALFLAFIFGSLAAGEWRRLLSFANQVPFALTEPIFGENIGYYVFTVPAQRFLQGWVTGLMTVTLVGVLLLYALGIALQQGAPRRQAMKVHVSILGVGIFLLLAGGYWLDRYDILLERSGAVFGAGYTDVNARLPVLLIQVALAVLAALLLLVNMFRRGIQLPVYAVGLWAAVGIGGGFYAEFVQRFQVEPNELSRERPYIESHIELTRQGFGLDRIQEVDFPGEDQPSARDIVANPDTIKNIRLWDHEPLKTTYDQIQSIRRYYQFPDVDIDRYRIGSDYRQLMISARELDPERLALAGEAPTWVNRRLKFTHGYGVTASPVTEISGEGLPTLLVKNLPPVSTPPIPELRVTRPEIYFGEKGTDWVIVNTDEEELDYASETETKYNRYQGKGGVALDSLFKRAMFAWQMMDPNILLTALREDSRILYYRHVRERVSKIAPFLVLDKDPYVVITEGRLVYIQDAYTMTNRFPYSEPYLEPQAPRRRYNYIRNSVKAVVDAYDGTVDFYIADASDPIIQTYDRIFPGVFKPMDQMPAGLRQHVRYPEDLFNVQAEMYRTYHMRDPQVFYNKEDTYERPKELYLTQEKAMDAYYVIMQLPGESRSEFMLILPFTPVNKNNANAWLAGRSDGANYGRLLAFTFPKDKLVYGPRQVESRIDQDPTISSQFALWNQSGSRVLRGNLLFIPIGQSYLYVEPVYLQSSQSQFPELKRVVVAAGNRIAMEATLEESLNKIYGAQVAQPGGVAPPAPPPAGGTPAPPGPPPPPAPPGSSTELVILARQADETYKRAQDKLKGGDWTGYGNDLRELEGLLRRMVELGSR